MYLQKSEEYVGHLVGADEQGKLYRVLDDNIGLTSSPYVIRTIVDYNLMTTE